MDLFCGCGGFSLGFELAGFNILGGVELDVDASASHRANFPDSRLITGDISLIDDDALSSLFDGVDVVIGGFPCQGFSLANRNNKNCLPYEDNPLNSLFVEFLRVVRVLEPKSVVIENVPQILTRDNGCVKDIILGELAGFGYNVSYDVLLASDYGVPQNRRRAFIIGLKDSESSFDFDRVKKRPMVTVGDALSDLYYLEESEPDNDGVYTFSRPSVNAFQAFMRRFSEDNVDWHNIIYPQSRVRERIRHVPSGGDYRDVPAKLWGEHNGVKFNDFYARLPFDKPSRTIIRKSKEWFHYDFDRKLTVRELARLQSFPDDFIFHGSQGAVVRQIANAVPPFLAECLAIELSHYLNGCAVNE